MKKIVLSLITMLIVSYCPTPVVASKPKPGAVFICGGVGISSQSLADWNDDIDGLENALQSADIPADFEGLGPGFPLAAECGVMVTKELSISIGASYQAGSADNSYTDITGSLSSDVSASAVSVVGNASYWLAGSQGLFFSAVGGMIFGKVESEAHFREFENPANNVDFQGAWNGSGPVIGVGMGYASVSDSGTLLFGRIGYRHQKIDELEGTASHSQFGTRAGPPLSRSGEEMNLDFSGMHILIGIGIAFGGS